MIYFSRCHIMPLGTAEMLFLFPHIIDRTALSELAKTYYPIALTAAEACAAFWKGKKWTFSGSAASGVGSVSVSGEATINPLITHPRDILNKTEDGVSGWSLAGSASGSPSGGEEPYPNNRGGGMTVNLFDWTAGIAREGDNFYPKMDLIVGFSMEGEPEEILDPETGEIIGSSTPTVGCQGRSVKTFPGASSCGSASVSIGGVLKTCTLWGSGACSITLSETEQFTAF
jgi:hypothetical protein